MCYQPRALGGAGPLFCAACSYNNFNVLSVDVGSSGGTSAKVAGDERTLGGLAGRYATALYELADEAKALDAVAEDLRALRKLIDDSADLDKLVRSPLIERTAKAVAIDAILTQAGAGQLVRQFAVVVARNGRLFALPAMIDAFLAELARRRGRVTAEVVSARHLSEPQQAAVAGALNKRFGGKVALQVRVDPSLIGGIVVRIGSRMIDFSLKSKLLRLQLAMKGAQ